MLARRIYFFLEKPYLKTYIWDLLRWYYGLNNGLKIAIVLVELLRRKRCHVVLMNIVTIAIHYPLFPWIFLLVLFLFSSLINLLSSTSKIIVVLHRVTHVEKKKFTKHIIVTLLGKISQTKEQSVNNNVVTGITQWK